MSPIDPLEASERLAQLAANIDMSYQAYSRFDELRTWLGSVMSIDKPRIGAGYIPQSKFIGNRFKQEGLSKAKVGIVFLGTPALLQNLLNNGQLKKLFADGGLKAVVVSTQVADLWQVQSFIAPHGGPETERIQELFPEATMHAIDISEVSSPAGPSRYAPEIPLVADERIRRMIRLAIRSAPAVMLVGPPGTGKTTLLTQIVEEIDNDPEAYGFTRAWPVKKVTPEESWTTRDLVGGETVDEHGHLRFRPGHVLNAIKDQQWLMLDEANRADMDRIFGGLMTWLTGHSVELGPASQALDAPVVELGWHNEPENFVEGEELLVGDRDPGDTRESVRYLAGKEWRLLGTYNALDAQRVFRFGQALGRRFVRVPVPILTVEEFKLAIGPMLTGLPGEVGERIMGLYRAHAAGKNTSLGPALFFWLPEYVRAGLAASSLPTATHVRATDDQDSSIAAPTPANIAGLISEAYLAAIGSWLVKLDDEDLDELLGRLVDEQTLPATETAWIRTLLPALG